MNKVFIVTHTHELPSGEEDVKFIGVYISQRDAEVAVQRAESLPGFGESPQGFHIEPYIVGKDHWTEGFVTVNPTD